MGNWSDIYEIRKLAIYVSGGNKEAKIYANNRHQIPLEVQIEALDKHGKHVILSANEIFENIQCVDYKNQKLDNGTTSSITANPYVTALHRSQDFSEGTSNCLFYISCSKTVEPFKLCVRCKVNNTEYTTSVENNNNNAITDYVTILTVAQRQFTIDDLEIKTITETGVGGYNSLLKKYYIRFNSADGTDTLNASCPENNIFHYKQTGNYKGMSTSTDSSVLVDPSAVHEFSIKLSSSWTIKFSAKNHELKGVCLWSYRLWYGALWSYREWGGGLSFALRDQYGNQAVILTRADSDEQLNFYVVSN